MNEHFGLGLWHGYALKSPKMRKHLNCCRDWRDPVLLAGLKIPTSSSNGNCYTLYKRSVSARRCYLLCMWVFVARRANLNWNVK